MFRWHFLDHFSVELQLVVVVDFFLFITLKMIKNVFLNKIKTLVYVSSSTCLLCVCNFPLHLN